MRHPLQIIPRARQWPVFLALLVTTFALTVLLQVVDRPLRSATAPYGIVSFEFAGAVSAAQAIVQSWSPTARSYAGYSLGLDYSYMLAYALTIGLACLMAGDALAWRGLSLADLSIPLAWAAVAAAALDAVENLCLAVLLFGRLDDPWPQVAWWCAAAKFALISAGILYGLYAGLAALLTPGPRPISGK